MAEPVKAGGGIVLRSASCESPGGEHAYRVHVLPEHPAFQGHFPGRPVLPGMDVVRAVVRAASEAHGSRLRLRCVDRARLTRPIAPGADLELLLRIEEAEASVAVDARLRDDAGRVARVTLTLVADA